jgi:NTE family protein
VTDLDTGGLLLFGDGGEEAALIDVLCATCALPVYYPPVLLGSRRCGDGGLRGPLPLETAARLAEGPVVAVDVGPGFDAMGPVPSTAPPVVRAHDDAVGALMAQATASQLALWRADPSRPPLTYIRPKVERAATFRVDRVGRYAEDGYLAARDALARPTRA